MKDKGYRIKEEVATLIKKKPIDYKGSFENLDVWKESCRLATEVYKIVEKSALNKDWALGVQIKKSAVSVPSNIAEGFERGSNRDFARFLWIAKGSAGELRTQLYLAVSTKAFSKKVADSLISDCMRISRKISTLIKFLNRTGEKNFP